jgi:hypothetical protein
MFMNRQVPVVGGNPMVRQFQGIVHGKTIELDRDPGIAEGERVDVMMRVA